MTIRHNFPSDNLVPGTSAEVDFTSGSRSVVASPRRVLILGPKKTAGTGTVDAPVQVFGSAHAEDVAGAGSPLAVYYRAAARTAIAIGRGAPEFWIAPLTPPGGGTAATGTFTVTGPSTAAGPVRFSIAGIPFVAYIASGANATTIAAAMVAAVNAKLLDIPGTVANVAGVITYTHSVTGVDGNDVQLRVESDKLPAGVGVVAVQPVNGAGALTYTTALTNSLTKDFDAVVFGSHTSTEITAALTHLAEAWGATKKRWRQCYFGERGSIATATTLAAAGNDNRIVIAGCKNSPALPGVLAAALATMVESRTKPNFNHNFTLLPAIPPTLPADEMIDTEIQTCLIGGVTPITLDRNGTGVSMVQTVHTTKTTHGGNPFTALLPIGNTKATIWSLRQCDYRTALIMSERNVDAQLIKDVKIGIEEVLRAGERLGYLHNVDQHVGEIGAEADPDNPSRIITAVPDCPVPIANQVHAVHRMYVEAPAA